MKLQVFFFVFILVALSSICLAQQQAVSCPTTIEYANRNQVDPSRSTLSVLKGRVIDEVGNPAKEIGPIPACLGLFTENDRRLVASTIADEEGKFEFKSIKPGLYRLVVRDPPKRFVCC